MYLSFGSLVVATQRRIALFYVEAVCKLAWWSSWQSWLLLVLLQVSLLAASASNLQHVPRSRLLHVLGASSSIGLPWLHLLMRWLARHRHIHVLYQLALPVSLLAAACGLEFLLVTLDSLMRVWRASEVAERYLVHLASPRNRPLYLSRLNRTAIQLV